MLFAGGGAAVRGTAEANNRVSLPGFGVPGLRDFNGDGHADIAVVMASGARSRPAFHAYVLLGQASTKPLRVGSLGARGFPIRGTGPHPSVALVGDMNGDGLADVAVSSASRMAPVMVWIIFGGVSVRPVDVRRLGSRGARLEVGRSGRGSVEPGGDINGDGFADLLTYDGVVFGRKHLRSGRVVAGSRYLISGGLESLTGVGDLNGDGLGDLVGGNGSYGGCPEGEWCIGRAWTLWGHTAPWSIAPWPFVALLKPIDPVLGSPICAPSNGGFGLRITPVGDLDGEGPPDFVVLGYDAGGDIAVLDPGPFACRPDPEKWDQPEPSWNPGTASWPLATSAVAGVGDANGDGFADLVTARSGSVYLRYGHRRGTFPDGKKPPQGPSEGHRLIITGSKRDITDLYAAGDINGDGRPDLLVETGSSDNWPYRLFPGTRYDVVLGSPDTRTVNLARPSRRVLSVR